MAKLKKYKELNNEMARKKRIKNWLKDNKIYFETVMAFSLTIMGIIISIVSLSFQYTSNELQEKQSLAEAQLNMPVFNISKSYYKEHVIDGISYPAGTEIKIINNGGNISSGYLRAESKIEIIVHDKEYNNRGSVVIENTQQYLKGYSYYDAQTKSFTIKKDDDLGRMSLIYFLDKHLYNEYKNYNFTVLITDYINIQYTDFQNHHHNEWYELNGGDLLKRSPVVPDQYKALQANTMTNEELYLEVKNLLDILLGIEQ